MLNGIKNGIFLIAQRDFCLRNMKYCSVLEGAAVGVLESATRKTCNRPLLLLLTVDDGQLEKRTADAEELTRKSNLGNLGKSVAMTP